MPGLLPFQPSDGVVRRFPNGGAERSRPNATALLRHTCMLAGLTIVALAPAGAQETPKPPSRTDIVVTGNRSGTGCSDQAQPAPGSADRPDLACLNHQLQAAARAGEPAPPPADATTAQATVPSKVGTFSYAATRQRMGSNFGKSATPARPPAPHYTIPALPGPQPR